jgi:hypothetical protein
MPTIRDLNGLWQRSLLAWPDGRRDTATQVRWLQGSPAYIDLRQPANMPDFSHVRALDDLRAVDCAWLAGQQGFAGHLTFDGRYFEWMREIDFQAPTGLPDAGSLDWEEQVLIERGRDAPYIEHWHRDSTASVAPSAALLLRESQRQTSAILLRVGSIFMFARDRMTPLPMHGSLQESVAGAASLDVARALLDCEISYGAITQEWRIIASTLPFKVDSSFDFRVFPDTVETSDQCANGAVLERVWDIVESEGDIVKPA